MKIDFIKARLFGMRDTLSQVSQSEISEQVSWTLAEDFNSIIQAIAKEYPETDGALPHGITRNEYFATLGEATFLDLQTKVTQVLKILEVVESGN